MRLSVLLKNAGYGENSVRKDMEISGISSDTRVTKEGDLFVALRGARFDSHELIDRASENGAVCAVVDHSFFKEKGGADGPCSHYYVFFGYFVFSAVCRLRNTDHI